MIRIDEIYLSVQGEGPRVGEPTVFVRTGGCNLRCPGWPCDTQHAIDPKYRNEWRKMSPDEIVAEVDRVADGRKVNVCLTGGEPFLQPQLDMHELQTKLLFGYITIEAVEAFTNGTLIYPQWAMDDLYLIMDWKLPGSGEDSYNENRLKNLRRMEPWHAVKFVIKDRNDFDMAVKLWEQFIKDKSSVEVFYGVAWGHLTDATLVKWVQAAKLPWRLNVQMHNHIWDRTKRGI